MIQQIIHKTRKRLRIGYFPVYQVETNTDLLLTQVAGFFEMDRADVDALWAEYSRFAEEKHYEEQLGNKKTLSHEEAFILYVMAVRYPIGSLIEIGTQHGKSTRRIIDINDKVGLGLDVVCFDIEDSVQYFEPGEATLVLKDITGSSGREVFDHFPPGLIFLDARPYHLLRDVISEALERDDWLLAIHDCGRGLCNPRMTIDKDRPEMVTSQTGIWERYVLAELLGVKNPLSESLDDMKTETHRLRVFETRHGLAVIMPQKKAAHVR